MQFHRATLNTCREASGTVVVIDVLRAFSTAAYAFANGAESITLAGTVEEALALREAIPGALVMGEVGGLPVKGFDLSNSPSELVKQDLTGRRLIQRTSHGVQGFLRSQRADHLLGGSLVCARATARFIHQLGLETVTFVLTGVEPDGSGDEDAACADYIEALLRGEQPDPALYIRRVLASVPGQIFADPARPEYPALDLDYCTAVDRFDFALPVERVKGLLVMRAKPQYRQA
jgi:2-phosphosulfolactate phosphatase